MWSYNCTGTILFLTGFALQAPLVYHYGHLSPGPNEKLYNKISSKIAQVTKERFEKNKKGEPHTGFLATVYRHVLCVYIVLYV